eukprot:Seg2357.4 transcript_id=Seg2357.4/GoldUCD/mRNA.D3Y31 product="alpha-crystallin A chain" protein_id=Seg2357.4/GoldUCD/D3Y31
MKVLCSGIIIAVLCISLAQGRFGLGRRRSLFDDDFFMKPWTTFDMMTKDFDDHFRDDPFFQDDEFEDDFFNRPFGRPTQKECEKTKQDPKASCKKVSKNEDKGLAIPKLAARVVKNDDQQFKFAMNLKGFGRDEISVKVQDDFLKISGKKSCPGGEKKKCPERSYFRYQYLLPKHTDLSKVKASFSKDGYLIVDIPKLQKIEDANDGLKIAAMDEEYLPKLKEHVAEKKKNEEVKKEKETNEGKSGTSKDDDVTVEDVPA